MHVRKLVRRRCVARCTTSPWRGWASTCWPVRGGQAEPACPAWPRPRAHAVLARLPQTWGHLAGAHMAVPSATRTPPCRSAVRAALLPPLTHSRRHSRLRRRRAARLLRRRSLLRRRRGSRGRRICATCCVCAVMRDGQEGVREVLRRDGRWGCGDKARVRQEEWAARDRSAPVRHSACGARAACCSRMARARDATRAWPAAAAARC